MNYFNLSLQIDVLQAEVAALKTLVLSTSPTSPCKDLPSGSKVPFKKGHVRNKSTSSAMLGSQQELSVPQPIVRDCKEVRDVFSFSLHSLCDQKYVDTIIPS